MKKSQGITTITLIVTIVVMLILASVTITVIVNGGLFNTASKVVDEMENVMGFQQNFIKNKINKDNNLTNDTTNDITNDDIVDSDDTIEGVDVNPPLLQTGMTPVKFDETNQCWMVTTQSDEQWYDYANKKWANIMLQDGLEYDNNGKVTKQGSMFVWIPRFAYKITETKSIQIKFLKNNTNDFYEGTGEGYIVHPSFTNNIVAGGWDKELTGFWVAKYEAGFQANTTDSTDATKVINSTDTINYSSINYSVSSSDKNAIGQTISEKPLLSYPVFKPLTYSYNNISINDCYAISSEISNGADFYGLSSTTINSHLMKNSEWGAVAYLSYSSYGRNGQELTSNSKNLNNLNSKEIYAITGYAGDTANGITASTTGNMTGVFDLSGGVEEYVAGYLTNGNGNLKKNGALFVYSTKNASAYLTESTKTATAYPYNESGESSANNIIAYGNLKSNTYGFGDAITETTGWNGDTATYPGSGKTFIVRGGNYGSGTNAGIFAFDSKEGAALETIGFRAVLINNQ